MLFSLLTSFTENYSFLNVFKYITFRTGLSVITSFYNCFHNRRTFNKTISKKSNIRTYKTRWPNRPYNKKIRNSYYGGVNYNFGNFFRNFFVGRFEQYICFNSNFYLNKFRFFRLCIDDLLKIKQKNSRGLKFKIKTL